MWIINYFLKPNATRRPGVLPFYFLLLGKEPSFFQKDPGGQTLGLFWAFVPAGMGVVTFWESWVVWVPGRREWIERLGQLWRWGGAGTQAAPLGPRGLVGVEVKGTQAFCARHWLNVWVYKGIM